jgi:hypothetical protein
MMDTKKTEGDRTVILSDKDLSESGVQGGKIIAEHLVVGSFLFGFSFLGIGLFSLFYMVFVTGLPKNLSLILLMFSPQSLAIIIGVLLLIGASFMYRAKQSTKK